MKITKIDIIVILFLIVFMFFWIPIAYAEDKIETEYSQAKSEIKYLKAIDETEMSWQQSFASQISQAKTDHFDNLRKCNNSVDKIKVDENFHDRVNTILRNFYLKPINHKLSAEFALKVLATYSSYNHDLDEDFTDMGCELSERQMIYRINSILSFYKLL